MVYGRKVIMMCGRYAIFTEEDNQEIRQIINEINERYKNNPVKIQYKTGEIFPTDKVPVIFADPAGNKIIDIFKWGFPGFTGNSSVIINARSETIHEKPTFRRLLPKNRCLLPASAFYEWKKTKDGKKEKYLISPNNTESFYMAGIYNTFIGNEGKPFNAFVILTTDSNCQMAEIHDRMPVIIEKGYEYLWLDSKVNYIALKPMLKPYEKQLLLRGA